MSINTISYPAEAFGLYSISSIKEETYAPRKKFKIASNIMNSLGWIPIIGTIVGIARILGNLTNLYQMNRLSKKKVSPNQHAHIKGAVKRDYCEIARGLWELTSLGFVLALVDIPFSIARKHGKV